MTTRILDCDQARVRRLVEGKMQRWLSRRVSASLACMWLLVETPGVLQAQPVVAGMRVNYGCLGSERSVIGDVDRTWPRWRVFVDSGKGVTVELAGVAVAWY